MWGPLQKFLNCEKHVVVIVIRQSFFWRFFFQLPTLEFWYVAKQFQWTVFILCATKSHYSCQCRYLKLCRLFAQILIVHINLPWWIRLQNLHYGVALWDLFVCVKLKPTEQLYNPVIPILQLIFFLLKCMSRTPLRNIRQPSTIELIIDKLTTRVTKLTLSYY